ncbi:MAG: pseudouridine synthase [Bacteroidetes bacterium]|jgi:23S rRNA pseudouridine2605 synthase|nr:pseudouridine synthase [Bacteroidota bacterium]
MERKKRKRIPRERKQDDENRSIYPGSSRPSNKNSDKKPLRQGSKTFKPRVSQPEYNTGPQKDEIRLNKYLSNAGVCSRREADKYIEAGVVTVNGKVVTELGTKVSPRDDVRFNNERLSLEQKVYLLLNKPKDFTTTTDDPHADKTVMDLVKNACRQRVYPVGRLDKKTTGVLLLTNDGELSARLTHPKHNHKKIYHVYLDQNLKKSDMDQIAQGIELNDGPIRADEISYVDPKDKKQVGVEIHSGRNRIVRRIFEKFDYKVLKLDRVYFAGLTKKGLPRGKWRFLSQKEVDMLRMTRK